MCLKKIIKSIQASIQNKKNFLAICKTYFPFLKNGLYFLDCSSAIIYKLSCFKKYKKEKMNTFNGLQMAKEKRNKFFDLVLHTRIVYIKNKNSDSKYTLGILSSRKDVFKLFDYKNKWLLSLYKDKAKKDAIIKNYLTLKDIGYPLPNLLDIHISSDTKFFYIKEVLINKVTINIENAFLYALDKSLSFKKKNFLLDNQNLKRRLTVLSNYLKRNNLNKELIILDDFITSNSYKICPCHGDFYPLNLLFDGKNYYVIDYEDVANHIFFFDFYKYMISSFYAMNYESILKNYYSGKYDCKINLFFEKNGVKFNKDARHFYMIIAIFEFYNFKTDTGFSELDNKILKKYQK